MFIKIIIIVQYQIVMNQQKHRHMIVQIVQIVHHMIVMDLEQIKIFTEQQIQKMVWKRHIKV
jgi:hypothetical protein